MFQTRLVSAVPNELAAECIIVTVFAQLVHIVQVSLLEAQPSEQSFPAHCLKLCPTPCCFTWFHNTALSVRGASKQSLGVAVLVRSLLITTGVRIVILCPVTTSHFRLLPTGGEETSHSLQLRQQEATANMQEEVGQL